jgi:hypothetical protein
LPALALISPLSGFYLFFAKEYIFVMLGGKTIISPDAHLLTFFCLPFVFCIHISLSFLESLAIIRLGL